MARERESPPKIAPALPRQMTGRHPSRSSGQIEPCQLIRELTLL
jgi:hypothetical protein